VEAFLPTGYSGGSVWGNFVVDVLTRYSSAPETTQHPTDFISRVQEAAAPEAAVPR
jgi:hypothetical protein